MWYPVKGKTIRTCTFNSPTDIIDQCHLLKSLTQSWTSCALEPSLADLWHPTYSHQWVIRKNSSPLGWAEQRTSTENWHYSCHYFVMARKRLTEASWPNVLGTKRKMRGGVFASLKCPACYWILLSFWNLMIIIGW